MNELPDVEDPMCYVKLLFLADLRSLSKYGEWLSKDVYIHTDDGICLSNSYRYLTTELLDRNVKKMYHVALAYLSKKDLKSLNFIIAVYGNTTLEYLNAESMTKSWRNHALKNTEIPLDSLAEELDVSEARVLNLKKTYKAIATLNNVFNES